MKLFIDTANINETRKANDMGVICGVATNPSLIVKEKRVIKWQINLFRFYPLYKYILLTW